MMVQDAYDVAVSLELLNEIKSINPQRCFMFTEHPIIDKISRSLWLQFFLGYERSRISN